MPVVSELPVVRPMPSSFTRRQLPLMMEVYPPNPIT